MSKQQLGRDLRIVETELGYDLKVSKAGDLETIEEEFNLAQALIMRLNTARGELLDLGHSSFGSRLHELVGEPNNERTRELARIYAMECISRDPRVEEIVSMGVETARDDPNRVDISISVKVIDATSLLNIVFPFYLEVA